MSRMSHWSVDCSDLESWLEALMMMMSSFMNQPMCFDFNQYQFIQTMLMSHDFGPVCLLPMMNE